MFSSITSWMRGTIAKVHSFFGAEQPLTGQSEQGSCEHRRAASSGAHAGGSERRVSHHQPLHFGVSPCRRPPSDPAALLLVLSIPCPLPHYTQTLPRRGLCRLPPWQGLDVCAHISLVTADFIYCCRSVFPNKTESEQINGVTEL